MFFSQEEITPYRGSTPPATIYLYHIIIGTCVLVKGIELLGMCKNLKEKWIKLVDSNESKSVLWNYKIACSSSGPCLLLHYDASIP
jgi:hypothetical protein